jgi:hypothetical protein
MQLAMATAPEFLEDYLEMVDQELPTRSQDQQSVRKVAASITLQQEVAARHLMTETWDKEVSGAAAMVETIE